MIFSPFIHVYITLLSDEYKNVLHIIAVNWCYCMFLYKYRLYILSKMLHLLKCHLPDMSNALNIHFSLEIFTVAEKAQRAATSEKHANRKSTSKSRKRFHNLDSRCANAHNTNKQRNTLQMLTTQPNTFYLQRVLVVL